MRQLVTFLSILSFVMLSSTAFGHDGDVTFDIGIGDEPYMWEHGDADPFKGWATVTVTNTGELPWGDFHFEFYDPIGGQDISNLAFLDASGGGFDPCSSQSGLTWEIDNEEVVLLLIYFSTATQ